eukprot:CAMPEP_0114319190 /NCGR_PEP_ID=MMETSP0059-20121206/25096_1 /TAXON_ID=36894 /ORGANISM="Pyramimonas parkeae, Strain CCMP726" /LENGTH=125 /DNA_ID=CAMNT_0001446155 /DNA_START=233 /DNA_END=610 /DNA_ORIENTATION=+
MFDGSMEDLATTGLGEIVCMEISPKTSSSEGRMGAAREFCRESAPLGCDTWRNAIPGVGSDAPSCVMPKLVECAPTCPSWELMWGGARVGQRCPCCTIEDGNCFVPSRLLVGTGSEVVEVVDDPS